LLKAPQGASCKIVVHVNDCNDATTLSFHAAGRPALSPLPVADSWNRRSNHVVHPPAVGKAAAGSSWRAPEEEILRKAKLDLLWRAPATSVCWLPRREPVARG